MTEEELQARWNAGARADLARMRAESLHIPCTYCSATPGEVCINLANQGQVEHFPAHMARLKNQG